MLVIYILFDCIYDYPSDFLLPDEASINLEIPDLPLGTTILLVASGFADLIHLMCLLLTIASLRLGITASAGFGEDHARVAAHKPATIVALGCGRASRTGTRSRLRNAPKRRPAALQARVATTKIAPRMMWVNDRGTQRSEEITSATRTKEIRTVA